MNRDFHTQQGSDTNRSDIVFVDDSQPLNINTSNAATIFSVPVEEEANPLDQYLLPASKLLMSLKSHIVADSCTLTIAPGWNKILVQIILEENCAVLVPSYLFPTDKFGHGSKRKIPLTPSKYFDQRLLNYTQRFPSESNWIVYCSTSIFER